MVTTRRKSAIDYKSASHGEMGVAGFVHNHDGPISATKKSLKRGARNEGERPHEEDENPRKKAKTSKTIGWKVGLSFDTTSYPQSTQVTASSQTPLMQSQLETKHNQLSSQPENFWNHALESKPATFQREGSSQSGLSCAMTEPASREPSPLLHEDRDPTLPVPVPQMPGSGGMLGRKEVEHASSPPTSPCSHALSMGLKERDFAYEDFPGKAEHQNALAAMKTARKAVQVPHTGYRLHPVLKSVMTLEIFNSHTQVQLPIPLRLPASLLWCWIEDHGVPEENSVAAPVSDSDGPDVEAVA
ncbi:hypothetical protein M407DRAFT_214233 [Tulasnella calospora MUT 4182]|uniref:Uncharacterized protein n=1 Tax=Tulasnella calospora MUT 4182 TaxID=1051891 RepID=A0A0C3KQE7_9AGAM|nr:hypothetical protein M407DRAFT_214233 [Tulasnella calospora MUT 4182]